MNEAVRHPLTLPVPPHLYDHQVMNRPVLPAAHALCHLAEAVREQIGSTPCTRSGDAQFEGFLDLPEAPGTLPALAEIRQEDDGSVSASLLTRIRSSRSPITRVKKHIHTLFLPPCRPPALPRTIVEGFSGPVFPVEREDVYRDLVPFGPAFRNCCGQLELSREGVTARITAPEGMPDSGLLGSPFVFDAALHAANVWTQRYRGIVVFPVGYAERHIPEPTRDGGEYVCKGVPGPAADRFQEFHLWILSPEGRLHEVVLGVRMRELFPDRLHPPRWILA